MKVFFTIFCSILFLMTTMQQTMIYLLYKLDQQEITEEYCINKEMKNSTCHGKCHLQKVYKKIQQEQDHNPTSSLSFKIKDVEYFLNKNKKICVVEYSIQMHFYLHNTSSSHEGFLLALVKPPTC